MRTKLYCVFAALLLFPLWAFPQTEPEPGWQAVDELDRFYEPTGNKMVVSDFITCYVVDDAVGRKWMAVKVYAYHDGTAKIGIYSLVYDPTNPRAIKTGDFEGYAYVTADYPYKKALITIREAPKIDHEITVEIKNGKAILSADQWTLISQRAVTNGPVKMLIDLFWLLNNPYYTIYVPVFDLSGYEDARKEAFGK
jgi:hypothetical protein